MSSFKIIGLQVLTKRIFKVFTIYSNDGHLDHVTLAIYTNVHTLFLSMLHIKMALIGRVVSEKKMFDYYDHIHAYVYNPRNARGIFS